MCAHGAADRTEVSLSLTCPVKFPSFSAMSRNLRVKEEKKPVVAELKHAIVNATIIVSADVTTRALYSHYCRQYRRYYCRRCVITVTTAIYCHYYYYHYDNTAAITIIITITATSIYR
jgi:hypothetical protein